MPTMPSSRSRNSTEGAVGRSMDLLFATPLKVCGEVVLRIHQNLMTREASLDKVTKVYSHAQSLAQCHEWLNRNLPNVPRISVGSNSRGRRDGDAGGGRCGHRRRGCRRTLFNVPILVANIEDEPNNTTRFLVLGRHDAGVSGRDKTSLIMSAPNRTGSLHGLLLPLAEAGVSMTRLESRPARHTLWDYVFFVDIDGHQDEPKVAKALAELKQQAAYLKVLGSYPSAVY